ncbi:hypothetical protein TELCIR_19631, partial [Teladorsagia circumcincta]
NARQSIIIMARTARDKKHTWEQSSPDEKSLQLTRAKRQCCSSSSNSCCPQQQQQSVQCVPVCIQQCQSSCQTQQCAQSCAPSCNQQCGGSSQQ